MDDLTRVFASRLAFVVAVVVTLICPLSLPLWRSAIGLSCGGRTARAFPFRPSQRALRRAFKGLVVGVGGDRPGFCAQLFVIAGFYVGLSSCSPRLACVTFRLFRHRLPAGQIANARAGSSIHRAGVNISLAQCLRGRAVALSHLVVVVALSHPVCGLRRRAEPSGRLSWSWSC